MNGTKAAVGLDFGTNSVRALAVDVETGAELAESVFEYRSGDRGVLTDPRDPNVARQDPGDYWVGLESTLSDVVRQVSPGAVAGVGVATTGSSPMPLDSEGNALALVPEFKDRLAAQCWLWKDHSAHEEAAEITATARERGEPYLDRCGGTYSSEWFWSKILRCARSDRQVFEAAASWAEIADWIPAQLCGIDDPSQIKRSRCAAGHKALFVEAWGGLPSEAFLGTLDPGLAGLRHKLYGSVHLSIATAGTVDSVAASRTGLLPGTHVAVGSFDAHCGAVGSGIKPGVFVKIIGTSTCDCLVHPVGTPVPPIPGLCGMVEGSILPDMWGIEAGQSAVGDIFNWWSELVGQSQATLSESAARLAPGESGLLGLDWHNGNRTVLVDPLLSGMLVGQTLQTNAVEIYRAFIEATAFGALRIVERVEDFGVKVEEVVACGGIAEKSPLTMQIYADVLNRRIRTSGSNQACALGAAIYASVASGCHSTVADAQSAMVPCSRGTYTPHPRSVAIYRELYRLYGSLHDGFGVPGPADCSQVMKELIAIRSRAKRHG